MFFANQTLEATAADSARLIMTGQAQNGGYSQADFKKRRVRTRLWFVRLRQRHERRREVLLVASTRSIIRRGHQCVFDNSRMSYSLCGPGAIQVVTLYYQWPIYVSMFSNNLSNLNGNKRLLIATAVFRNEPYGPAGAC